MERGCLPPLNRASFASGGPFDSALRGAAAEPGRWALEMLRDRHISPQELARLVNDFLAGKSGRRSSGS
jgi:hypothetical protein